MAIPIGMIAITVSGAVPKPSYGWVRLLPGDRLGVWAVTTAKSKARVLPEYYQR